MNSLISKVVCYVLGYKLRDLYVKHFYPYETHGTGIIVLYSFADRWIKERTCAVRCKPSICYCDVCYIVACLVWHLYNSLLFLELLSFPNQS